MTSHVRDAALWLADDPTAGETRDEATRDLLAELGEALSDALGMVGARGKGDSPEILADGIADSFDLKQRWTTGSAGE